MNNKQKLLRWTGVAGIVAAVAWTLGDALLLGNTATPAEFPHLETYKDDPYVQNSISFLNSSTERLAAGALVAVFTTPIVMLGIYHIFLASKRGTDKWPYWVAGLLFVSETFAPFVHGSFFYVAEIMKTIPQVDAASQQAVIDLAERTTTWLFIAYGVLAVPMVIAYVWLTVAIALGRTNYPRWVAITNPLVLMFLGSVGDQLMPFPLSMWLEGAGLNLGLIAFFTISTIVLWNKPLEPAA